jgi:hypothetical protein
MKILKVFIILIPIVVIANPLMTNVINEFQTDTILGQKLELNVLYPAGNIPLLGMRVISQSETSYVDTEIILPQYGFATIDQSVLSGPFSLGLSDGAFWVYLWDCFTDWIIYPDTPSMPAPQPGASVARYVFDTYPSSIPNFDWYLDFTPTFNDSNDDYPGCCVSGYIFLGSNPFFGAQIIADCYDSILNPQPFHTIDTAYSQLDGSYSFDSLVSARFYVNVIIPGYSPMGELTRTLHASRPINNLDFTFNGIEDYANRFDDHFSISPNPFKKATTLSIGQRAEGIELKIYDINGRLVNELEIQSDVIWNGNDADGNVLPTGVYICRFADDNKILTRKIIKIE